MKTEAESVERTRCAHQRGKVLFLSRPMRFLLMVVEHGTASRWWELLGRVGTHWLFLLAFCSLEKHGKSLYSVYEPNTTHQASSCGQWTPTVPLLGSRPQWGPLCTLDSSGIYFLGSHQHPLGGTQARGSPSPVYEP